MIEPLNWHRSANSTNPGICTMKLEHFNIICNVIQSLGATATPLVVAIIGARYIRRQSLHEASISEKAKHYSVICPLINRIYSYRLMVGDFLERKPEEILKAKREADHEFWAYHYIWSEAFIANYNEFMDESFSTFGKHGTKALINAESHYYPIQPEPSPSGSNVPAWQGFSNKPVDRAQLANLYRKIGDSISNDLGMRR